LLGQANAALSVYMRADAQSLFGFRRPRFHQTLEIRVRHQLPGAIFGERIAAVARGGNQSRILPA
jgi:hypothetical protein